MTKSLRYKTADFSVAIDARNSLSNSDDNFRQVFEIYDDNKDGILETITAGKMLMDLYRSMNK